MVVLLQGRHHLRSVRRDWRLLDVVIVIDDCWGSCFGLGWLGALDFRQRTSCFVVGVGELLDWVELLLRCAVTGGVRVHFGCRIGFCLASGCLWPEGVWVRRLYDSMLVSGFYPWRSSRSSDGQHGVCTYMHGDLCVFDVSQHTGE